jgi:uncharacterized protein YciI
MRRPVLLLLLLAACAAPSAPAAPRDYVLVFLHRAGGTPTDAIMAGHLANIGRLAQAGKIVVAGPFEKGGADATLSGLFILDVPTVAEAEALTGTDPSVEAKVFRPEAHPLTTAADLRGVLIRSLAAQEERKAAGTDKLGAGMSHYVIAIAQDAGRAAALDHDPHTCVAARLGGDWAGRGLWILEVKDLAEAQALVTGLGPEAGAIELAPWFGSSEIAAAKR